MDLASIQTEWCVPQCVNGRIITSIPLLNPGIWRPKHVGSPKHADKQPVTITTDSYIEQIVATFEKHLGSIDGGAKIPPEIYLSVRQLLSAVGNSPLNLTKKNVHSEYVEKMLTGGTVSVTILCNKLRSLEYFCIFVCNILSRDFSANLQKLQKCLPFWRSSLRKKCTIEDVQRRIIDEAE